MSVIHIRNANFKNPSHVYIGRGNASIPQSPLANPFAMRDQTDTERTRVIAEYRRWIWAKVKDRTGPQYEELVRISRINNLVLVCYCAPKPCHGNVIEAALNWVRTNRSTYSE